jgi:tetraacyldisaccharide 4'-kinase
LLRNILLPFVPVYGAVTKIRNYAYDQNIFDSKEYDLPIICVGNLSVGGTGKTPMIEYLIRLLNNHKLATLSRGYKRNTKGFQIANETSNAGSIGDEPFQFYSKFDEVIVAVDADRQNGITQLRNLENSPEIILLDDAFQHRKVKAGFYVLLTAYDKLYVNDMCLPTGDLREPISGAKRANVIVVTKCPKEINEHEKKQIIESLKPKARQSVFFSSISYAKELVSMSKGIPLAELSSNITLVTGIANPKPLLEYLNSKGLHFEHLNFSDHHNFSEGEIANLKKKGFVLTTEKDYMRLKDHLDADKLYYLPIEIEIDKSEVFDGLIKNFVNSF